MDLLPTLRVLCEKAMEAGREIDLKGCDYGPHKTSGKFYGPQPYYHFLAGLVRTMGFRKILEIGTNYGGSILAIDRGCGGNQPGVELVTIDKIDIACEALLELPHIKRICLPSLLPEAVAEARIHLHAPIDLLYIDSKHTYVETQGNFTTYGAAFRPRYVIFDDIHLNEDMERVWREMTQCFGERAFDATQISERKDGFGILEVPAGTWG